MTDARMLAEIIIELYKFFEGDMDKVEQWLNFENLNFGGTSPMALIELGRINKVYQFVMKARDERGLE